MADRSGARSSPRRRTMRSVRPSGVSLVANWALRTSLSRMWHSKELSSFETWQTQNRRAELSVIGQEGMLFQGSIRLPVYYGCQALL